MWQAVCSSYGHQLVVFMTWIWFLSFSKLFWINTNCKGSQRRVHFPWLWHLNLCTSSQITDPNTQAQTAPTSETALSKLNPHRTSFNIFDFYFLFHHYNKIKKCTKDQFQRTWANREHPQSVPGLEFFGMTKTQAWVWENDETRRVTMKRSTPAVLNVSLGAWTDNESRSKGDFSLLIFFKH